MTFVVVSNYGVYYYSLPTMTWVCADMICAVIVTRILPTKAYCSTLTVSHYCSMLMSKALHSTLVSNPLHSMTRMQG